MTDCLSFSHCGPRPGPTVQYREEELQQHPSSSHIQHPAVPEQGVGREGRQRRASKEAARKPLYSHGEGRAAVGMWRSPQDRSPRPAAGKTSALIQSHTWTWACCSGLTAATLRESGCRPPCVQSLLAPDRYWVRLAFGGWYSRSAASEAGRKRSGSSQANCERGGTAGAAHVSLRCRVVGWLFRSFETGRIFHLLKKSRLRVQI